MGRNLVRLEDILLFVFSLNEQLQLKDLEVLGESFVEIVEKKELLKKYNLIKNNSCYTVSFSMKFEKKKEVMIYLLYDNRGLFEKVVSILSSDGVKNLYELIEDSNDFERNVTIFLQALIDMNFGDFPIFILNDLVKKGETITSSILVKVIKIYLILGKFEQAKLCYYIFFGENDLNISYSYGEQFVHHAISRLESQTTLSVEKILPLFNRNEIDLTSEEAPDLVMSLAHELFLLGRFSECQKVIKELISVCQKKKRWISLYYGYFLDILSDGLQSNYESARGKYDLYSLLPYSTKNMQHMLDVAIIVSSIWCGKEHDSVTPSIDRVLNNSVNSSDNVFYQIYTLYCKFLVELTKPDFSIRKFRLIENKIISFFQYNQVSEAWNIPDFFSLYKLAYTKDKRIKMPDCIRQSFVPCFYQQKIRDYLFENKPKMKFPLFFVSLKRRMKSGFSDELYLNSQIALTRKENEVAQLLKNGYTYSDIASILCISVNTVKSHANSIYKKLGITGRYDLIASQG